MFKIRVVSYNIHKGFSLGNMRFMLPELARSLEPLQADLVFLQETVGENHKHKRSHSDWPDVSQFEYLAGESFSHFVYGKNAVYEHGHHGNAILSRHAVKRWRNIDVSTNRLESRGALHCVVEIGGTEVHLVNSHLSLFERARHRQIAMIGKLIQDEIPHGSPTIVAGDFNDWRGTAGKAFEHALGVRDAFSLLRGKYARSFPSFLPLLTLDRVYFSGIRCLNAQAMNGLPWVRFSDHLPLVVDFGVDFGLDFGLER